MRVIVVVMTTKKEVVASACIAGQVEPFHTERVFRVTRRDFFDAMKIFEENCAPFSDSYIAYIHFIDSNVTFEHKLLKQQ